MTLRLCVRMGALALAGLIAASSGAAACDWHKNMTMASVPVAKHYVMATNVPVDLWLIPYLG
ncbi:MAG: hypothetical protein ACTHJ3_13005 [Pararhizobium sp.]